MPATTTTTDSTLTLLSGEDELASVHTLRGRDKSVNLLKSVAVLELDVSNGCTSSRIVRDVLDDTLDIAVTFGIVIALVAHSSQTTSGMGSVD
jgi:hypothetical protein